MNSDTTRKISSLRAGYILKMSNHAFELSPFYSKSDNLSFRLEKKLYIFTKFLKSYGLSFLSESFLSCLEKGVCQK